MTQLSVNYAVVLYQLSIPEEDRKRSEEIFRQVPGLLRVFTSPVIGKEKKYHLIGEIFPVSMQNFLKEMCRNQAMDLIGEVFTEYEKYSCEQRGILPAVKIYTTRPEPEQIRQIEEFLCRKYRKKKVDLKLEQDSSLIGGFIIRANGREIDWSLRGRLNRLQQKLMWR